MPPSPTGRQADQLHALYRLADAAARATALPDLLREVLDCLERTLKADRSSVLLFDPDGVMRFKAWRNLSESYRQKVEGHSPWPRGEKDPTPVLVPDVAAAPNFEMYRATAFGKRIHALAFIPIVSGGSLVGTFMIYFDAPHRFSDEEVHLARIIAAQIASGVERARTWEALRRDQEGSGDPLQEAADRRLAERRLEAEHAVTRILAESQTLALAVPKILQSLGECLGCAFAAFWRVDRDATEIRCTETWQAHAVSMESLDGMCRSIRFQRGVGLPGRVWQSGTPAWIRDLSLDQNFPRLKAATSVGLKSGFAFPIKVADRFLGIMEFFLTYPAEPDQRLLEMMAAIGSEIGQFIERKQVEEALAASEEITRLQEANQAKDDFLAMLAHELRNPLNPIRSAAHIMGLAGTKEPELDRARGIIDRQVRHMSRLIDDLLDVSRISRGKILLRRERVNLIAIIETAVEDHRAEIEEGGHSITLELPAEALWMSGDPTRLSQIVGNILHNANKFTNPGGAIHVRAYRAPDSAQAVVSVRDTGIGMEPEMLERVFDTFTQADRSLHHSGGGLGLGLALVKGLVGLHGGSVHASSEGLGKGSEFSIRLPLEAAPPLHCEPAAKAAPIAGTCRVLLIEDHADSSEAAAVCLALSGHTVEVARTGAEGLERARRLRPDVVLCDIGLEGGIDGYGVARALRAEPRFATTYLVAVTGYGREEDIRLSREAGFDLHLVKPVDPKALERLLGAVASRLAAIRT